MDIFKLPFQPGTRYRCGRTVTEACFSENKSRKRVAIGYCLEGLIIFFVLWNACFVRAEQQKYRSFRLV